VSNKTARGAGPASLDDHWLIERRVRVYPRILLVMFALAVPVYALTFEGGLDPRGRPMGTDFIAFWSAGRLAAQGLADRAWNLNFIGAFQLELYPGSSGPTQWAYPPTTLPLVLPFGELPHLAGLLVWTVVGGGLFLVALAPLVWGRRHAWPLVLAFPAVWLGILSGQIQFFVAALVGAALILLPRRPVIAGVLIGLVVIKPQLGVVLPMVLVAGREWRAFAAAGVTSCLAVASSAAVFGISTFEAWWGSLGVLSGAIDDGTAPVYKFVTPYMAMRTLGLPGAASLVIHALVAIVAAVVVWRLWRRSDDPMLRGAAAVAGTFLVTPYAADYDLVVLAFPITWLSIVGLRDGWVRGDRNLVVLLWLVPVLTAPLAVLTHVTVVPLLMALLLHQLWVRAGRPTSAPAASQPTAART
jgi:hypothetical protein